ncbi:MAG: TIGR00266 family protein [Clostridia bacterium]
MNYKIIGQTVPVVEMKLNAGETVYTQSGGMAYQSEGIAMKTNARGGVMKSLGRMFSGESIFMANYTAQKDGAVVAFASTVPGNIIPVDLSAMPSGLVLQKGAFLCAEENVETSIAFTKKFSAGLFGGEGFILQKAIGRGNLFLEVDGDTIEKQLAPGEVLKVDTGNVVAFEPTVSYEVETVKGLGNIFLGGEGLFLTRLVGPGRVILQSQNFKDFAGRLIPYMPASKN